MSSSVFSDIKPKFLKKEKEKFNVNYWVWKNNDKVIQIAAFAAKQGYILLTKITMQIKL